MLFGKNSTQANEAYSLKTQRLIQLWIPSIHSKEAWISWDFCLLKASHLLHTLQIVPNITPPTSDFRPQREYWLPDVTFLPRKNTSSLLKKNLAEEKKKMDKILSYCNLAQLSGNYQQMI